MNKIVIIMIVIVGAAALVVYFVNISSEHLSQISPSPKAVIKEVSGSLQPQSNNEGAVEITVTPRLSDQVWGFEIVMNTHSTELSEDMVTSSILIVGGKEYKPILWEGDPSGGHHRVGILKFKPVASEPVAISFRIKGVGDISERIFEWQINW